MTTAVWILFVAVVLCAIANGSVLATLGNQEQARDAQICAMRFREEYLMFLLAELAGR